MKLYSPWAVAFAIVGVSFAIAIGAIFTAPSENASVACVKAGGEWSWRGNCIPRK